MISFRIAIAIAFWGCLAACTNASVQREPLPTLSVVYHGSAIDGPTEVPTYGLKINKIYKLEKCGVGGDGTLKITSDVVFVGEGAVFYHCSSDITCASASSITMGETTSAKISEKGTAKLRCGAETYLDLSVPNYKLQRTPFGAAE